MEKEEVSYKGEVGPLRAISNVAGILPDTVLLIADELIDEGCLDHELREQILEDNQGNHRGASVVCCNWDSGGIREYVYSSLQVD